MVYQVNDLASLHTALNSLCRFLENQSVPGERIFDSKLVASELLGNVLKHSNGEAKLTAEICDGFIQLRIYSSVTYVPPKQSKQADVYAENGRGLFLVDSVCEERRMEDGAIVIKIKIEA